MDKVSISLLIGGAVSASLLQSTDKASSALKNLNGNLQKLERAAKSADDFGKLKASLDQTRQKLKEAGAETARLAVAMRTVKEPSDGLKKAFEAAKRQSEGLKREYREQVSSLSALRSQLRAAGVDTARLPAVAQHLPPDFRVVLWGLTATLQRDIGLQLERAWIKCGTDATPRDVAVLVCLLLKK